MKKLLVFIVFLFLFSASYGQVFVDGVNINKTDTKYCIVENSSLGYYIIYGQKKVKMKAEISDKAGNITEKFNILAVLNFMDKNGWELISSSESDTSTFPSDERYIFRKKE